MPLKPKKPTLADKINSLITAAPTTFGSDDEAEDTKAKVVEQYEDDDDSDENAKPSKIRRLNVETLDFSDSRYAGKKVSRKDLYSDSDQDGDSIDEDSEADLDDETNEQSVDEDINHDDEEDEEEDKSASDDEEQDVSDEFANSMDQSDAEEDSSVDDDEEEYGFDIGNPLLRNREESSKIKTMSDTNLKADVEKGNCVRSQLKLWEALLEMRIKLQKCVVTSNQMPQYDAHKTYKTDVDFSKKTSEVSTKLSSLLGNLLQLQSSLLKQYPETRNLKSQKKVVKEGDEQGESEDDPMDEEIPSDTEDEAEGEDEANSDEEEDEKPDGKGTDKLLQKKLKLPEFEKILRENHKIYMDYRNSVIQKWNEKTRIATGSLNKGMSQTTLKQIEFALSDKSKLRKKTQLKRSEYTVVGKAEAPEDEDGRRIQEYDPEIYDDDDFYHQLLRDLIEYKSSDVTDPIQLSKQWIQLQNMRRKMKRKIDTRATKGRRIRFNVHNKLVNFMAPITVNDTWTDLAKNELYNSLFGKIKGVDEAAQ